MYAVGGTGDDPHVRIARILTRLNLGGPARQVLASDPLLQQAGHTLRVFAGEPGPGEGDLFESLMHRGIDVVRVPSLKRGLSPWDDWNATRFLRRALVEFRPEVVHTHASKAGTLGRRAANFVAGARRVHTFHGHVLEGYFPGIVSSALIAHERRLARRTDRIVAVSHATADDLLRLGVVEESRLVVVPPGIDLTPFEGRRDGALRRRLGLPEEAFLVGIIGRLAEVKRPQRALEVFDLLAGRYPHLHLVFVGDGPERGALERGIRAGTPARAERVHLLGAMDSMGPILGDLDAVLLTSRTEGLPVALIEAGAAGVPAVAAAVGGVEEVLAHERTGFVGENVDELAYGLARLLDEPEERANMGQRARMRVTARHSAQALAQRLEALYQTLLQEEPCAC